MSLLFKWFSHLMLLGERHAALFEKIFPFSSDLQQLRILSCKAGSCPRAHVYPRDLPVRRNVSSEHRLTGQRTREGFLFCFSKHTAIAHHHSVSRTQWTLGYGRLGVTRENRSVGLQPLGQETDTTGIAPRIQGTA